MDKTLPSLKEQEKIKSKILDYIISQDSPECKVKLIDIDKDEEIYRKKELFHALHVLYFQGRICSNG